MSGFQREVVAGKRCPLEQHLMLSPCVIVDVRKTLSWKEAVLHLSSAGSEVSGKAQKVEKQREK